MVKENWKGISIPPKCRDGKTNGADIYRRIFEELGITDITEFDRYEHEYDLKEESELIGKIANSDSKKPIIIGSSHHLTAFAIDDSVDFVYFDAHSDDYSTEIFHCGSFINFMCGKHYCIGARDSDFNNKDKRKVTLLKFDESEKIIGQPFRERIFLSYDIDVFHCDITMAHAWGDFGYEGRMFPEQVKDLSTKIVEGRDLIGINVAEYLPFYERSKDYKTAKLIVDLLKPLL